MEQTAAQKSPRVTVWLSSYQHGAFLRRAVESILGQTYRDFQVWAMDDGSQDDSWQILQEYAARCPSRFRIFRHEENRGGSHMEDYLEQLPGEYIAIAHSDDAWLPRKLERQVEYLDAHPEIAACFTAVQLIDDNGQPLDPGAVGYESFRPESHSPAGWLRRLVLRGNCLCHPSLVARRQIYTLPGVLAQGLYALPDYHRWLVLAAQGQGIAVLPQVLTRFRLHADGSNISADLPGNHSCILAEQMLAAQALFAITDTALLRQAFPEAEHWLPCRGEVSQQDRVFAMAKALLALDCTPGFRAEACRRLYDLLNRPEMAQRLRREYGYTARCFRDDLERADPFGGAERWRRAHTQRCASPLADPAAAELARQTARAEAAEAALYAMRQSRIWRLTAPLRRVVDHRKS